MNERLPAAVIAGLGAWVPPNLVTNEDLAGRLDTTDEWIRTRSGIGQRYHVPPGLHTSDLAVAAGQRAMASAAVSDVDCVVLATETPDRRVPGTAPVVAERLGLRGRGALDVNAACSGFVYGLATGAGLIATGTAATVLVIGADTNSLYLDPADRSLYPLMGDGAGAVVLRRGDRAEPGALGPFTLGSDGSLVDLITSPGIGSEQRSSGEPMTAADVHTTMQGRAVFEHAVVRMSDAVGTALELAGWPRAELDRVVAHQANLRILRAVGRRLGLTDDQVPIHLDRVGNTVAASIPLALADATRSGGLKAGHRTALVAFGAGASWAATTVHWPELDLSATHFPYDHTGSTA